MEIARKIYYFAYSIFVNIFKKNVRISFRSKIKPGTKIGQYIKIGKNSYINGEIGDYSYVGSDCILNAKIGKFCSIASNVKVINSTHPSHLISTSPVFYSRRKQCGFTLTTQDMFNEILFADDLKKYGCIIGNDVWIGENVLIKGGVLIGNGAIIAMGSVVTNNIPPYSIYGGVPAREISKRFESSKISILNSTCWWDKSQNWIKENCDLFLEPERFFKEIQK